MDKFIEKTILFNTQINKILELIKPLESGCGMLISKSNDLVCGLVLTESHSLILTVDDIKCYFDKILAETNIQYNVSDNKNYICIGKAHDEDSINAMRKGGWGDRRKQQS